MAIPHNRWWLGFFPLLSAVALLAIPTLLWMKSPSDPGQQKSLQVSRKDQLPPIVEAGLKPKPRPAEPTSTVLAIGQKAATQAGEKRRLMLPDGSTLYLNERTSIELPQDRQLKLTAGEVFVEAIEANAERGSFTVSTPSKSLTALEPGSRFVPTTTAQVFWSRKERSRFPVSKPRSPRDKNLHPALPISAQRFVLLMRWIGRGNCRALAIRP